MKIYCEVLCENCGTPIREESKNMGDETVIRADSFAETYCTCEACEHIMYIGPLDIEDITSTFKERKYSEETK